MTQFIDTLVGIFQSSGFARFGEPGGMLYAVMICVGCFLLYLAIVKEFEPLILLPMAFGMILANLPGSGVIHMQYFVGDGLEHPMWVEILNNGGLAAFALTEPGAGSDAGGVSTRAVHNKEEGTYTLNGTKMFITNGGLAEIFLVFANTRKTGGIRGLTAFIVPKDTPGFSVGKKENKMGIRPSNTTELVLQDVVIPESYRVGREGEGFRIAMNTLDSARPFVGAVSVGIAQAALDCAVKYAKERRQFGQPIASFQMVQGMLADMAMKVETARLMVQKACWMRDQGMEFSKEAAMAKCYAADTAMQVTTDAVQVMGGYGYTKEYPVEKMMRDAKIMQIYEGTNQIQRLVIANKLLY